MKISEKYDRIIVIELNDGQYKGEIEKSLKRKVESMPLLGGTLKLKEIEEKLK
jgi:hypothetical protein